MWSRFTIFPSWSWRHLKRETIFAKNSINKHRFKKVNSYELYDRPTIFFFFYKNIHIFSYIKYRFCNYFFYIFDKITSLVKKENLSRVDPQSEVLQKRCKPTHDWNWKIKTPKRWHLKENNKTRTTLWRKRNKKSGRILSLNRQYHRKIFPKHRFDLSCIIMLGNSGREREITLTTT